jgi:hypothetical protein
VHAQRAGVRGHGSRELLEVTCIELLQAADYILKEGEERVILCERGIRTFETATRFTLDLGAVPWLKLHTHLPVIVDPSHASGDRRLVGPLARAAAAAGADGIIVEVHGEIVRGDLWAGTIVFRCRDGDGVRIISEETEQPSRDDLLYWATGLSTVYLDGAFDRAASRRS